MKIFVIYAARIYYFNWFIQMILQLMHEMEFATECNVTLENLWKSLVVRRILVWFWNILHTL